MTLDLIAISRTLTCLGCVAFLWAPTESLAEEPISFSLPIACEVGATCFIQNYFDSDPSSAARDYYCGDRTNDGHDGTDFRLPSLEQQRAGVDVLAAAAGIVVSVRDGMPDLSIREAGSELVRGRECGNGVLLAHRNGWVTQYCHMARDSIRVKPGQRVEAGTPIGRVGLSGKTEFPHLHFSVRLHDKKVDPFAYGQDEGACATGSSLWDVALRDKLSYRQREIINFGFASGPVTMEQIESGEVRRHPPSVDSPALVAYVRAIGLKAGDELELKIVAPDGSVFFQERRKPLDRAQAQFLLMGGRKGRAPWPSGIYTAHHKILHEGKDVLQSSFTFSLPPP
jgi:murein DD-endopeptidase MepM/ murein hydrolase activator NlpD